ncbi:MAG: hypothetical protein ACE5G9_12540 [Nitrospinales bacterium]
MDTEKPHLKFALLLEGGWGDFSLRSWRLCGDFGMINFNLQMAGFDMPKLVFASRLKSCGYKTKRDPVFGAFCREIR